MKIELLYFPDCLTYQETEKLTDGVVRALGVPAVLETLEVKTAEDAARLRFLGSPTIRVNGLDIEPAARSSTDFGLKCRVYRDGNRFVGVPPRELLERAIEEARNGQGCCASHG
jgi:hypothetical protein